MTRRLSLSRQTASRLAVSLLLVAAAAGVQARDKVLHLPIANVLAEPAAQRNAGALSLRFGAATAANADLAACDVQVDASAEPLRDDQNQRDSVAPSDESVCQHAFDDALVRLSTAGKARHAHFLASPKPRAFVFLEDGTWRFWADDAEVGTKVFDDCARLGERCWRYAVDDTVVRNADESRRIGSIAQWRAATDPIAPKDEHQ